MDTVLAGDLGGTKCRFALIAADFSVHGVQRFDTVADQEQFLAECDRALAAVLARRPAALRAPAALGIGTAGVVALDGRSIVRAPNLPLDGVPLAARLGAACGLETTLLNDGRASAWGEYLHGEARGADPLLCLFFGTGIGVGLMVGGVPFAGADNAAGEIGHTTFVPGGRRCPCGADGHFEAYCGGRAIRERAVAEIGPLPGGAEWTVGAVATHGSAAARRILADAESAAVTMTANACTLLNPRALVLGGGVLDGWPALREHLIAGVRARCSPAIAGNLQFAPSRGGSDAVLWGAAAATGRLFR
jgi:glucokinase